METILVPVDETPESERALPVGVALATALGAHLELVTVDSPHFEQFSTECYQRNLLDRVPVTLPSTTTVTFSDDSVGDAIAAVAHARPDSVVCMATRASNPVAELVVGGTADELLRGDPGPVVLVGPACDPGWPGGALTGRRLLVALDGSPLDEDVVATALRWATALRLVITFATVTGAMQVPGRHSPAAMILTKAATAAEAIDLPVTTRLLVGEDAGATLLRLLREVPAALLVVGSHRRGPWARLAMGANALWIVHRAVCPVLVAGTELRRDAP